MPTSPELALLLHHIDQAYDEKSWHGTNLRGALRGLKLGELTFRPRAGRHNIWELALHCAYWKHSVRRRLTGDKRGSFPLKGSNFFLRPEGGRRPALADWKRDLRILGESHQALRAVAAELPARDLDRTVKGSTASTRDVLLGIAAHDLYHAGQIKLLRLLARAAQGIP